MVDLSKTEKLLKTVLKNLETHFTSEGMGAGLRKKVITKVKHYVKNNSLQGSEEGDEDLVSEAPTPDALLLPPSECVAAVS